MSDTAPDKWRCDYWRCAWVGTLDQALSAPDPFTEGQMIYACPHCRDPNNLVRACDIEGCNEKSTCGIPVPDARRYVPVIYKGTLDRIDDALSTNSTEISSGLVTPDQPKDAP